MKLSYIWEVLPSPLKKMYSMFHNFWCSSLNHTHALGGYFQKMISFAAHSGAIFQLSVELNNQLITMVLVLI